MTARITRVGGGVADLIDRIPDADLSACLYFLAIGVLSAVEMERVPEVSAALDEFRERGSVSASMRLEVAAVLADREQRGFRAAQHGDLDARDRAFFQARMLSCVAGVVGVGPGLNPSTPFRERLHEAAYEAVVALRGTEGVTAVLGRFSANGPVERGYER